MDVAAAVIACDTTRGLQVRLVAISMMIEQRFRYNVRVESQLCPPTSC